MPRKDIANAGARKLRRGKIREAPKYPRAGVRDVFRDSTNAREKIGTARSLLRNGEDTAQNHGITLFLG